MKKFPNALVIILATILFAWVLTFVISSGTYERVLNDETGVTTVVAGSYQQTDATHLSPFDLLMAIPKGIAGRADLIVLIFILGGCFYLIEQTGTLNQGLNQVIVLLKGKESVALVIISLVFISAGMTINMYEEIIAMTPVLLIFGRNIGYNNATVVMASMGSAVLGAAFSPFNPFGVIIAQKEAGLALLSGYEFRLVVLVIAALAWIAYLLYYASKNRVERTAQELQVEKLSGSNKLILLLLVITFVGVAYGLIGLDWGFNEMSACFFVLGLAAGLIAKFGINKTTEVYIDGIKEMVYASMIIGLANSITIVLKEGSIIDSVIYGLFEPLKHVSPSVSAVLMMFSHSIVHIPIASNSGQAILTMPILAPLSDLIGLSRQTAVLAYQYGGPMMDMVAPTAGPMMAIIAIAKIKYTDWLKIVLKPVLILFVIAAAALLISIQMGYN